MIRRFAVQCAVAALGAIALLIALALVLGQSRAAPAQLLYEAGRTRNLDIYLIDLDHALTVNLTRSVGRDTDPVWSPDGSQIAFETRRAGYNQLYVMDHLGRHQRPLLDDKTLSQYAAGWSTDGAWIYFRSYPSPSARAFQIAPDGTGLAEISRDTPFPDLLPSYHAERYLVMSDRGGEWGIYRLDPEHGLQQLTANGVRFGEVPVWSADGTRIAFISSGVRRMDIYVMDADGSNFKRVTADGMYKRNLVWRP